MQAQPDRLNRLWFYSKIATAAVLLSGALFMFALSSGLAPCNRLFAQSTSCNVGDTQIFTGATQFQGVVQVGATPIAGNSGQVLVSSGSNASPEWGGPGVAKTANQTVNNSNVLVDDNELFFAVEANAYYQVVATLLVDSASNADWSFQFTAPAGATVDGNAISGPQTGTVRFSEAGSTGMNTDGITPVTITFAVDTAATPGNVLLRWAQGSAQMSNTVVMEGSALVVFRMD